jgi:alkanesulfonate monooxygenase SsuD/methylene tetrahydromethanopterin reductase-like flavin-dependent oxidoreductase (luciferase family)
VNVVTSSDAFTGENFRRGDFDYADRYERAGEFIRTARRLWDSWAEDEIVADQESGVFVRSGSPGAFEHRGPQFDIRGNFNVPRSPQGHPVILQAGDSEGGRELAAATADAIFSRHNKLEPARAFYNDAKARLAKYGRKRDDLKILPGVSFVLGDTPDDAQEQARIVLHQQFSPQTAILLLEQVWNRDLPATTPKARCPTSTRCSTTSIIQGRARIPRSAEDGRNGALADAKLSIRELIIATMGRLTFVAHRAGSPRT